MVFAKDEKKFIRSAFVFILFLLISSGLSVVRAENELGPKKEYFKIDRIEIQGNKKVESEAILEKIRSKEGTVLDNYLLQRDIKSIYGLNYFERVEAHGEEKDKKKVLVFKVKERPIIKEIFFEGNNDITNEDLKEKIKSKEFSILDVNLVKSDVGALQKHYEEKGYYLANVSYELRQTSPENVEVVYKVKEFDKVKVKKITFLGNKAFRDDELKSIMETGEETLFSFMSGSGNFKEFNFETDIERLKYFYKTKGYLQVNVGKPEVTVSEDRRWLFISVKVNEGPQFAINDIFFEGELLLTESEFKDKIILKKGETYSEESLRQDIQSLTEIYQDEGYAFVNVLRTLNIVPGENKVDVHFSFEKGKIAYFGKIHIKGNTKTRDKVVRRELKIREGMKFSGSQLRISKENVNRLGFFEPNSVVFNTISPKDKDDVLDVDISVKERNTGQISLGAGYSTASGGFLQASIAQKNFRGLGQDLSFTLNLAKKSEDYRLGFIEPYLFDSKWTAGGDIFKTRNDNSSSFDSLRQGFDTRIGYPIFDYTRIFLVYKFEQTKLSNVRDPTVNEALENGVSSSVEFSLIQDLRDHRWEPSKGYYAGASVEYAGVGGDQRWLKSELDGRYYKTLIGDLVLRTRIVGSRLFKTDPEKQIPRSQKYVLGGARNLRGYNYEDIGPITQLTVDGRTYTFNQGGLFSLYGTLEMEHPLVREAGLKWVVFFDAGNVYEKYIGKNNDYSLRSDYGFGFRWFSPIGPLRFEFGYPINPRPGEDSRQFHFDIGQLF